MTHPRSRQTQPTSLVSLGRAACSLREQQGLSARDLAKATGVSAARIAELEEGRFDPDFELLVTLASSLGVRLSIFFVRAEEFDSRARSGEAGGDADTTRDR